MSGSTERAGRLVQLLAARRSTSAEAARRSPEEQAVSIEVIDDWRAMLPLATVWDELGRELQTPSIFRTWEYVSAWWQVFGRDSKLRVLAARDRDGAVIGLAPFIVTRGAAGPRRLMRHLTLIGCIHEPLSQFMDFLIRQEWRERVGARFASYAFHELSREWDLLSLPYIEPSSAAFRFISEEARHRNGAMWERERIGAPYCELPSSWDALYRTRSKRFRANLRKCQNRLAHEPRVEILVAGETVAFDEAFEAFLSLHDDRWGARSRAFAASRSEQLMRLFARKLADQQRLLLLLIRIDGEWAAAGFELAHDGVVYGIQSGWNPKFTRHSIGTATLIHEMQWCIARGLREFNFLAGEEDYKLCWMTGRRELLSVDFVNPASLRARAFAWARSRRARLRARLSSGEAMEARGGQLSREHGA